MSDPTKAAENHCLDDLLENVETEEDDSMGQDLEETELLNSSLIQSSGQLEGLTEEVYFDSNANHEVHEKKKKESAWERWTGILIGRDRLADEHTDSDPIPFLQLFRFASKYHKVLLLLGFLTSFLVGIAEPFFMVTLGWLIDILMSYSLSADKDELWDKAIPLVALNLGLGIVVIGVGFFSLFLFKVGSIDIIKNLRIQFLESLLRQNAEWLDRQKFGALNSQLNENIYLVEDGIGDKLAFLTRGVSIILTCMAFAFYLNWRMALLMSPSMPLSMLLMISMDRIVNRSEQRQQKSAHLAGAVLQESVMNVKTVQSCNGQRTMVAKYNNLLDAVRRERVPQHFWSGVLEGLFIFALYAFNIVAAYFGIAQLLAGHITAGQMNMVTRFCNCSSYIVGIICPDFICILRARVAASIIYKQIDMIPDSIDCYSTNGQLVEQARGRIQFHDVNFRYPNRKAKAVLNGVCWAAEPGEHLALVGHSGSGKSTCMSLLTRLYECNSGCVEIDGVDVKQLQIASLRQSIGIVQQEPTLFNCSIFDNIALGDERISMEKVKHACGIANANDFVRKLKDGYSTVIGADGVQLSGGQKQRIAIARAIVRDPAILLLDEATSALDAESEILVQDALQAASKGRTTIIIAHRLSTLRNVDKIVVLDQGRVVEMGNHSDLLTNKNSGFYAGMVKAQQFDKKKESVASNRTHHVRWDSVSSIDSPVEQLRHRTRTVSISQASGFSASSIADITTAKMSDGVEECHESKNGFLNSGIFLLYRNCRGNFCRMLWAVFSSLMHTIEYCAYHGTFFFLFFLLERWTTKQLSTDDLYYYLKWFTAANLTAATVKLFTCTGSMSLYGCLSDTVVKECKVRSFESVLDQSAAYFDRPHTSNAKIIQRISNDTLALRGALDRRVNTIVSHILYVSFTLIFGFLMSWQMSSVVFACIIMELVYLIWLSKKMVSNWAFIRAADHSSKTAVEIIENVKTIQLLTKEKHFVRIFIKKLEDNHKYHVKAAIYESVMFASTRAVVFLIQTICICLGTYFLHNGTLSTTTVFGSVLCLSLATDGIIGVVIFLNDFIKASSASNSIFDMINAEAEIVGGVSEDKIVGEVDLRKIHFAYPTRKDTGVASGLSLRARPGQTIALVGASGAGKSTVISLLERFYEPTSGHVLIDHKPTSQFSLKHLRNQIALVGQEPILFGGSIFDNVRLGVEGVGIREVREACETANAARFIESLPLGYSTEVGEKGAQLSGGQKQRIAIARALVRQPAILLLDEATSALDAQSEHIVQKALDSASSGRTCITIAHRLSSIQNADRIYFIRAGRVVEAGSHAELIRNPKSEYSQLFRKQQIPI